MSPFVFHGRLTESTRARRYEAWSHVGEGFTGHAVEGSGRRTTRRTPLRDDVGVQIEGTSEIDESILACR